MDHEEEFRLLEHLGVVIPHEGVCATRVTASNGASGDIRVYKPRMSAPSPHRRSEKDLLPNNNLFCKTSVASGEAVGGTARVLFASEAPRVSEAAPDESSALGNLTDDYRGSMAASCGPYNSVAGTNREEGSIRTAAATRATSTHSSSAMASYKDDYRVTKLAHFVAGEPTVNVASPTFRFLLDKEPEGKGRDKEPEGKGREGSASTADRPRRHSMGTDRPHSARGATNRENGGLLEHGVDGGGDDGGNDDGFATPSSGASVGGTCRHGVKYGGLVCDLCINGALVREKAERLRAEHQRRLEEARRTEAAIAAEQNEYTRRVEERREQMRATVKEGLQQQLAIRASLAGSAPPVTGKPHAGADRPKAAAAPVEWTPQEEAKLAAWADQAEKALAAEIAAHNAEMGRRKRAYGQALREQIEQQRLLQERQRREAEGSHPLGDSRAVPGLKLLSQLAGRDDAPAQSSTQQALLARWAQARTEYRAELEQQIALRAKAKQEERRAEKEASVRRAAEQDAAGVLLEQQMQHHRKDKALAFGEELRRQIAQREEEAQRVRDQDRRLPQQYDAMSRAEKERVMQRWRQQREEEQAYAAALRSQILERRSLRERERKEGQLLYRRWCAQAVADQAGTLAETARAGAATAPPQAGPGGYPTAPGALPYTNAFVAETGVGQIQRLAAGGYSGGGRGPRIGPPPQAESGVFGGEEERDNGAGGRAYDFCSTCHRKMPLSRLSPWTPKPVAHKCTNTCTEYSCSICHQPRP